ncbi:MAG: histidine kinase, partial [Proteobacteria bacterium]|nr:histidine kinase [Pseudomonadota bacterium]
NTRFLEEAFADLQTALDKYAAVWREMKGGARPADLEADLAATLEKADVEYLTAEIPRAVSQSLEGLGRIGEIVRSMKEFAHPGPDTKAPLDLNQAILSTITVARNEWKYVADLETDLDPDLPSVPCVAGEINQVVLNLIVNAAQAIAEAADESSGEKGRILVGTRADGDWAEIRIADTGPGIPPNIRERVFDPFFTTKDPGKGTGQGLAIAYRVITDKHGGAITLTSEENHGTTFVIRLPLTTNRSEKAS